MEIIINIGLFTYITSIGIWLVAIALREMK